MPGVTTVTVLGPLAELAFWLEEMSSFWLELESAKPTMLPG